MNIHGEQIQKMDEMSEKELEQVSGGFILPDTAAHKSLWARVLNDIEAEMDRYVKENAGNEAPPSVSAVLREVEAVRNAISGEDLRNMKKHAQNLRVRLHALGFDVRARIYELEALING